MTLKVSPKAIDDITGIKEYICEKFDNPAAANRIADKIINSYERLEYMPYIGRPLDSTMLGIPKNDFRFLVCESYLIFYKVSDNIVSVDHVFHGKRDYCKLLFEGEIQTYANIDTT